MSFIFTGLNTFQQKLAQKLAKNDETRSSIYDRVGVEGGWACVTDGHRAYTWESTKADGSKYNAATGIPLPTDDDYTFPVFLPMFKRPENIKTLNLRVPPSVKQPCFLREEKNGSHTWGMCASDRRVETKSEFLFNVNMEYLSDAAAFVLGEKNTGSNTVQVSYSDDKSPIFVLNPEKSHLRVIVMPMRF